MRIPQFTKILLLALLSLLSAGAFNGVLAQDVIRAFGGENISADTFFSGTYTSITGPTIRETSIGQLTESDTIILTLPGGFEWNDNLTGDDIIITVAPVGAQNTRLTVEFTSISSSSFTMTVTEASRTGGAGQGPGRVTIEGLELIPTSGQVPNTGQILNTGTTGPTSVSYGNLSTAVGQLAEVRVETQPDGNGEIVPAQDLLAGNSLTVYSIGRDQGGNFLDNIALNDETDWNLNETTGGVTQDNLTSSSNRQSATISSEITGSATIEALYPGVSNTPSGTITISPRQAISMGIEIQPSATAIAGEPFTVQPVISLFDTFGNKVTTDNSTTVTASINTGNGELFGTLTQTASSGEVTFTDLFAEISENITLEFSSAGLNTLISNPITIEPGEISQLQFTSVPTSGNQGVSLSPVIVQLVDSFDNFITESDIQINTSIGSGTGQLQGTTSVNTNSSGQAIFDNINFDESGFKTILAELGSDPSINTESSSIEILSQDNHSGFRITDLNGDPIGSQIAGDSFDIRIEAINGNGEIVIDYEGTATLSSTSTILTGGGLTASFIEGVLETHSINLTTSGDHTITATDTDNSNISGSSAVFNISSSDVDFANTIITSNPVQIVADGESTALLIVQMRDQFENNLETGGETITLATDAGTLSTDLETEENSVTADDQNDGTYTATLTSSTEVETATIEAFENSNLIALLEVEFVSGIINEFVITIPQDNGNPADQTAGEAFLISVEAIDENGNRVLNYSGNLNFSTNSVISSGESAAITEGYLEDHQITLTQSGFSRTITAEDPDLFGIAGISEPFDVVANELDLNTSQVVANPVLIQNDGDDASIITVILRDEYSNRILTDKSGVLSINAEQIEENGNPSSGLPDASLSNLVFNTTQSIYTATLTSSTTIEIVEISAEADGHGVLTQMPQVEIVLPKIWSPTGAPQQQRDWTRAENWNPQGQPGPQDFVIIPGDASDFPDLDINVNIGSLEIQNGAQLILFGGNAIEVFGNILVNGSFDIEDNTSLKVGGNFIGSGIFASGTNTEIEVSGNISITNFFARTDDTILRLNGSIQQTITSQNLLAQRLEVFNDILVTSGDVIDTAVILISEGNTLELLQDADLTLDNIENIFGVGTLLLNNNTLVLQGDLSLLNVDTSEGTVVFGIRVGEDFAEFPDLSQQQISNLSEMRNAVVNNTEGIRTFDDIIIGDDGEIILENGELIISSDRNFIASNITYNNGFLTFRRSINHRGWRMLSTPVGSDYENFFNGLTLQGINGSAFSDRQPNLLYYDETYEGTDNQRWRTPDNSTDNFVAGRGYFFYVFGDIAEDSDYNDTLPKTLTASGQENIPQNSDFEFAVTYTAEADTGWNMVGNPFGATIDWDAFGWTKDNMDNVIYIWDANTGEYRYWNTLGGSHGSGRIAPFQGFWVKANSDNPSLSVNPTTKTTGGVFRKENPAPVAPVLALKVETENHRGITHFTFSENGSYNVDPLDAYRLLPFESTSYTDIFSLFKDGTQLAINNLPRSFGKTIEIPVHIESVENGSFYSGAATITWPELENIPESWFIELVDKQSNTRVNLHDTDHYSFEISANNKAKTPPNLNTIQNFQLLQKTKEKAQSARFKLIIEPGDDAGELPREVTLNQNFPNPFNPATTIRFGLPVEDRVRIDVYDVLGRRVHTVTNERFQAGFHEVRFDAGSLASGVYFYRLVTSERVLTKKMTLIK